MERKCNLIGLVGKARSGKDTVADYLVKEFNFEKRSFARTLKEMGKKYFDLSDDEIGDHKTEFSRRLLQGLGVLFREEIDKNYWVNRALDGLPSPGNFVVSDTRFLNESDIIKKMGGHIIRVTRDAKPSIEYGANHASETEQDSIEADITIYNDGTIDDLKAEVNKAISIINCDGGDCNGN